MSYDELLKVFGQFGLAVLVGILIGLEREMRDASRSAPGLRDFVLISLLGAFSTFLAVRYDALWFIALGYVGLMALLLSGYWVSRKQATGITTELAAMMTFFLGVLILVGMPILAIALAILTLGVLFPKAAIKQYSAKVSPHELQAVLLFLVITFIVLPIVPNQSLDHFATFETGHDPARRLAGGCGYPTGNIRPGLGIPWNDDDRRYHNENRVWPVRRHVL